MITPHEHKAAVMAQLNAHPFAAPDWLKSKHRQSSFASMHRKTAPMPLQRERWTTPDDDFLDLYFHETAPGAPLVLLLHGLEDNAETAYVRGFMQAIAAYGWNPVLLEFRSCGGELNHAPRLYHMGETTDLDFVIRRLAARYPHTPIHLLGFSLGANVVLKWLGEQRVNLPENLRSAATLSAPFDPTIGAAT